LGIGDWGLGPIPNPQSPIPNPQSPIPINKSKKINYQFIINKLKKSIIKLYIFLIIIIISKINNYSNLSKNISETNN
jgi:hypothetical protein